jgi:hypothetical protein
MTRATLFSFSLGFSGNYDRVDDQGKSASMCVSKDGIVCVFGVDVMGLDADQVMLMMSFLLVVHAHSSPFV